MKLRILSDLHVEFEDFEPPPVDADVVVLAGDIHVRHHGVDWARERFPGVPVLYVLGNHEYYGGAMPAHLETMKQQAAGSNVRVLENEALDIGGVTFLGCTLWTDFALYGKAPLHGFAARRLVTDYRIIRVSPSFHRLRPKHTAELHRQSARWLAETARRYDGENTVVITHHAPSMRSLPDDFRGNPVSAAYASNLDRLVEECGAQLWIHGHLHRQSDYRLGDTRVVCNPRGYPNQRNPSFVPDLVIEI
ncbi:MAG TPA: metallophosphoesterase [Gammaproteobacteria bacterium]|jgi:Icc-related predicted phosphoesterase